MEEPWLLTRNYGDRQDPAVLAVGCSLASVMLLTLLLRLYVRKRYSRLRIDDWAHIVSFCFAIAAATLVALGVSFGTGRHGSRILSSDTVNLKWNWISSLLFIAATSVVKLSICISLLPLALRNLKLKLTIYFLMFCIMTYGVVFGLPSLLECDPQRFIYDKAGVTGGECLPSRVMNGLEIMHSLMNVATDVAILALFGVPNNGKLLERRVKCGFGAALALGLCVTAAGIIRTVFVFRSLGGESTSYGHKILSICSTIEINLAIIASCSACLRPLLSPPSVEPRWPDISDSKTDPEGFPTQPSVVVKDIELFSQPKGLVVIEIEDEVHPAFRPRADPVRWMTPVDEDTESETER